MNSFFKSPVDYMTKFDNESNSSKIFDTRWCLTSLNIKKIKNMMWHNFAKNWPFFFHRNDVFNKPFHMLIMSKITNMRLQTFRIWFSGIRYQNGCQNHHGRQNEIIWLLKAYFHWYGLLYVSFHLFFRIKNHNMQSKWPPKIKMDPEWQIFTS